MGSPFLNFMNCYLCGYSNFIARLGTVRDNNNVKVLECRECGLVFLNNHNHISETFYQNSGMHDKNPDYNKWLLETKRDDFRRLNAFKENITNKVVLDFGCGIGGFLELSKEFCKESYGLELESGLTESFNQRELNVFSDYDALVTSGIKFDVITAFHVVEHLKDPAKTLHDLSQLLNEGGELIVEVPSSADALLTLYECKPFQNFTYWSQHLYLFNENTLKKLSIKAGLTLKWLKHIQRYSISNHLHWLSKGKSEGHKNWSFLDNPELSKAYENTLASLGITDTITLGLKI
jgi:2-polyprenyl-3-methyl-5-hydroxy-6-metoxy-1,4-benzoquinol methylase